MRRRSHDPAARPPGLRRRLALTFLALTWERLWPRLWPAAGALALALALALSGLLPGLPGWLHLGVLVVAAIAVLGLTGIAVAGLRLPDGHTVRRRLERDSGLAHRPLTGMDDRLAAGAADPEAEAVWRAHRERLLSRLRALRASTPRPRLAAKDTAALRAVPVLLLAVALIGAGRTAPDRLAAALSPSLSAPPPSVSVTAWVEPPGYTGLAPHALKREQASVTVPEGSRVVAEVHGGSGRPELVVGGTRTPLDEAGAGGWKGKATVPPDGGPHLRVARDGTTLAGWGLDVTADSTPSVAFDGAPRPARRGALKVRYTARDDYGLRRVELRITRPGSDRDPIVRALPVPEPGESGKVRATAFENLSAHVWAGLPVRMTLVAEDAAGQRAESDTVRAPLPARRFKHPVARKLVDLRRDLARRPNTREPVVRALSRITNAPARYDGDTVVTLTLTSAAQRLVHGDGRAAVRSVQELLWQTALRIEGGSKAVAARAVERAQQALQKALQQGNVKQGELQRLTRELRDAMRRFLRARAKAARNADRAPQETRNAKAIEAEKLQRMVKRIRELARQGKTQQAKQMLARLQDIMQRLQQNQPARMSKRAQQAQKAMRDVYELSRKQRELLDESLRRSRKPRRRDTEANRRAAQRQGALRDELKKLGERLGKHLGHVPGPLKQAGENMDRARNALRRGEPGRAVPAQRKALENLRQGLKQAGKRARQMMRPGARRTGKRDPLGRQPGGRRSASDVEVPDQPRTQRAREILDTLRQRAGERDLPPLEKQYIERLLDRF